MNHENLGWPLRSALKQISQSDNAVLVVICYQGLPNDFIDSVQNLSQGKKASNNNSEASVLRNYGTGSQILRDLGVRKMKVVSEPKQMQAISGFDLEITEYVEKLED